MTNKKIDKFSKRQVALCYVRQSYTRDEDDKNSPERQKPTLKPF